MAKFLTLLCVATLSLAATAKEMGSNPIFPGDFSDPGVFRKGDDYYAVRSTFGWQPGLQIIHSKDLVNWEYIGHAFKGENDVEIATGEIFGGIWGSDMIYNPTTKMYMVYAPIYTNPKSKAIYVFQSKKPEGPYSKGIKILDNDIDPGVFVDESNNNAIYLSSKASVIYRLTDDGLSVKEKYSKVGNNEGKAFGEGAEIVKKGGYYHYTCSEGGTLPYEHHKILSFRSKSLKGPWEAHPDNPVKYAPHTSRAAIQGPGHGELIQTQKGEWYITYHNYELDHPTLARQMSLEPVIWSNDGWWRPKYGKYPPLKFDLPDLPKSDIKLNQSDEFNTSTLKAQWYFHTAPDYSEKSWSLKDKRGFMRLKNYPGERTMDKTLSRFVLQTMVGKEFEIATKLNFNSTNEGESAGLILYTNMENYVQYGLTTIKGKKHLVVRLKYGPFNRMKRICKPVKGTWLDYSSKKYNSTIVHLKLKVVNPETATFYYSEDGKKWDNFGSVELFFGRGGLPDLGWQHTYWTGATMGIYIDSQKGVSTPRYADFDYFKVRQ